MLAKRIKELRLQKGMTQEDFADVLGLSQQTIAMWENGKSSPKIDALNAMADYFEVTTDYLLGRTEQKPTPPLSEEQILLLGDFEELDTINRQKVFSYIRDLIRSQSFSRQAKSSTLKTFLGRKKTKAYG